MTKFNSIVPKANVLLHGADYNPEQWLDRPDILEKDIELMKQSKCNVMSVGIFSWAMLEPTEGEFNFSWLDETLERLHSNNINVFLATPSGARPAWLSQKYPDVLRVGGNRQKNLHGERHNHCFSSPNYRKKVTIMNAKLAERYAHHPAVIGWHISNEYGGECHCDYCQDEFKTWLKEKYKTLDNLNQAWWSTFWSHTYSDWSQIESPSPIGENSVHGLKLDWKRFTTDRVTDFCRHEIEPLKAVNPELPTIANFMEYFYDFDYWKLGKAIDIISWDSYPLWHKGENDLELACYTGMYHDLMRTIKSQPFLLMESTPSQTNWQPITKLKKPGMHLLASMQAVAHGSDSVQYFQWRKSRGSVEKFHGAVVDHVGHLETRVGKEVIAVGETLNNVSELVGSRTQADVAIIFDWDSRWAMDDASGPRNEGLHYEKTVTEQYRTFWEQGINCDIIEQLSDFSPYKVLVAPILYMIKPGVAERIEAFVKAGGTFVATYWTGIVNDTDLCFLGGFPGGSESPLRKTLGIWAEEIDSLYDEERVDISSLQSNPLGVTGQFEAKHLCEVIHLEGAEAVCEYQSDFFAGQPCVTVNQHGAGKAYYVASRNDESFNREFYSKVIADCGLKNQLGIQLPSGVVATTRHNQDNQYHFIMNFNAHNEVLDLGENTYINLDSNKEISGHVTLSSYQVMILKK
ncbi:beta-galactosidase [Vibrio gangliei]|uniref:beta-galactosidase n=1 Tax=Vibrio gangliei TaxID=2077090 RepID=UPI000D016948|nr:beta-galactosidase [Vibrio gangliei]